MTASARNESTAASPPSSPSSSPSAPSLSPLSVPAFRALLLAQSCFGLAYSTFLILPKFLAVHLHAGPAQVGWVMATAALVNVVAVGPVARVSARFGDVRTLAIGALCMAAGAIGFAAVTSVGPLAFFCRVLQGLGWAFMFSSGGSLAMALAPPGRLSQAIALHGSSNLLTNAFSPVLAELGIARLGPAPVFAAAAAVAALGAWLATRIRPPSAPRPPDAPAAPAAGRAGVSLYLLLLAAAVGIGSGTMFTFHQPLALARGSHRISDFLVGFTLVAVASRLLFGRLINRLGPQRVAFASFVGYGLVIAAMVLLTPATLALHGGLFGLAHGLFWPAFLAVVLQATRGVARDGALARVNAAYNAGMVSVAALGVLAERAGYLPVFLPVGLLVTLIALGLRGRRG